MDIDRAKAQARQMGASEADIANMGLNDQEKIAREGIIVFEPNLPVFNLFMACSSQWATESPGMGGRIIKTGLRWPDVETRARYLPEVRALNEEQTDQLWRDITTLQNHALTAMQELREYEQS